MALPQLQGQQQLGGYTVGQLPNLSQPQQQLQNQSIQQLLSILQGGQGSFAPIEQQARQNFGQNVSSLAERFSSLGSGGSQNSSAFRGALGSAAGNLENQLAALKSQHQTNQGNLLSQFALQPSFQNIFAPPQQQNSALSNLLGGVGMGAGSGLLALLNLLLGGNR